MHVYVARIPFVVESEEIFPPERAKEIETCSNEKVRQSKYYVWKLLESALMRSFGLKMKDVHFTQTASGKWECPECCFSLSHSGDLVAVALSQNSIGVDVEKKDEARFTETLAKKILTEREEKAYSGLEQTARSAALNAIWTKKEALFKCTGEGAFIPRNVETAEAVFAIREIVCGDKRYLLTIASQDAPHAVFRCGEGLQLLETK